MLNCIYVGIGGFFGSICRYLIGLLPVRAAGDFPISTLAINIVGAFVLSLITAIAAKNTSISPRVVLMLKVGICGGFTTFSTFAYESFSLFRNGASLTAVIYILASVVLSVLAVISGQVLVH